MMRLLIIVGCLRKNVVGFSRLSFIRRRALRSLQLAPREVLVSEFTGLGKNQDWMKKGRIAELLQSGDLEMDELKQFYEEGEELDSDGYVRLCFCLAELFEVSEHPPREESWLLNTPSERCSTGEYIEKGEVVLSFPRVASDKECRYLVAAGEAIASAGDKIDKKNTFGKRTRLCVADLDASIVERCEAILLHVLDRIDSETPSIYEHLFRPCDQWGSRQPRSAKNPGRTLPLSHLQSYSSLRELYMAGELEWSENEPAINVYTATGGFGAHKDHLALTVLIPLTDTTSDFTGGGTAFWSPNASFQSTDGAQPSQQPTCILTPTKGTALIFGGDVTHAGVPVDSGSRVVLVASFSTRTPASAPDRVNGLLQLDR